MVTGSRIEIDQEAEMDQITKAKRELGFHSRDEGKGAKYKP